MASNLWKNVSSDKSKPTASYPKRLIAPLYQGSSFVQWRTNLPAVFCDEVITHYKTKCPSMDAKTVVKGQEYAETDHRKTITRWSLPGDWVPSFMSNYINIANEINFGFDICAMYYTECHMLEYGPGNYYHWHADTSMEQCTRREPPSWGTVHVDYTDYVRKLSFTLQLSDPDDYTGGEMQMVDSFTNSSTILPKDRGTLCVFDSRVPHRIKPVKTGKRYALVGWALGPKWK